MKTALDKINEVNAKSEAWVAEDPTNRAVCILSTDMEWWSSINVNTYEEMEKYLLVSDVYEATRDLYGYKRDWSQLTAMSVEQLECEYTALTDEYDALEAERQAIINFEKHEAARIRKEERIRKNRSDNFGAMMFGDKLYNALTKAGE
jgi:hypothetical protein